MTEGKPATDRAARMSRRISDLTGPSAALETKNSTPQTPDQVDDESSSDQETRISRKRPRANLARLVSQDAQYISENDDDEKAPVLSDSETEDTTTTASSDLKRATVPSHPNPLYNSNLLTAHVKSLRLEAELFPMRVQIARLMAHPTHNRRGLFNRPVDYVALGLSDYDRVITKPMDLGTVKATLHAVAYHDRDEVADDIRLVFCNAMTYNPPNNTVHIAAKNLLQVFEEAYQVMKATCNPASIVNNTMAAVASQSCSNLAVAAVTPKRGLARSVVMMEVAAVATAPVAGVASVTVVTPSIPVAVVVAPQQQPITAENVVAALPAVLQPLSILNPARPVFLSGHEFATIVEAAPAAAANQPTTPGGSKCGLRGSISLETSKNPFAAPPQAEKALKRAMNVAAKHARHSCRSCLGRHCGICQQGCLSHEPALLICTGSNCLGAKIRKGAVYYIAKDGSRQFCQRCYTNLQAVLPHTADQIDSFGTSVRYKRDLLKRKNEEEVAEAWLTCKTCNAGVHKICSMHNEFVHSEDEYECPSCANESSRLLASNSISEKDSKMKIDSDYFTFVSGSEIPVKLDEVLDTQEILSAELLPETPVSAFIQARVRDRVAETKIPNAEQTVTVRILSDCSKKFKVPEVVRKHFRQPAKGVAQGVAPPAKVNYNSKAITLFQKIDGVDVCIFCMYVQEYDCDDDFKGKTQGEQKKRVYIAYLDSVEHFRPRQCRTEVFHEILVAYLATARARGYESAHIWACPPSRGNSFVFWNHPASQRTPTKERLISWYHGVLNRGVESGVVTDVKSLFESDFPLKTTRSTDAVVALNPENMTLREESLIDGRMQCPPLMDGDFWIEDAVRVHGTSIVRHLKSKPSSRDPIMDDLRCPATQVAFLLRDKVMTEKSAVPFKKPVNAAALKLVDYHKVIKKPMDLGTVYSRCLLGEFETLQDVVADVELVFSNATRYNPKGNVVHTMAIETQDIFFKELAELTMKWKGSPMETSGVDSWMLHANTSMSLDKLFEELEGVDAAVEDDAAAVASTVSMDTTDLEEVPAPPADVAPTVRIPESPPMKPVTSRFTETLNSALLPNSGRKPVSHNSPSSMRRTSQALFALMNNDLELLKGGQDAIEQRMVGDDVWMMDKKIPHPPKPTGAGKKKGSGKKRKNLVDLTSPEYPVPKRRRQSWLGEEVGMSVRRMRTSFFTCSLTPKKNMSAEEAAKEKDFQKYIDSFVKSSVTDSVLPPSRIADARHALLEFSQYRNLEFDTLRRAKYSTSVLLYHLHHDNAPGLIPTCSSCDETIENVRWHRIRRVEERHHTGRVPPTLRAAKMAQIAVPAGVAEACHKGEELCACCYDKRSTKEEFIPLPVSFKA
jgi:hypothetical protein